MKPVFALVGRPNVGKSTLFNRLTASRDALTVNLPGLTRDRQYGKGEIDGRKFLVIDMGGITPSPEGLEREVVTQALQAIAEADCVLFLVDARDGLTPEDSRIHQFLREQGKPGFLVVNKTDGLDPDQARAEFHELGAPEVFAIAAAQGAGVKQLMRQALDRFEPVEYAEPLDVEDSIRITFAGRPNVGKSTLVNRLLGEDRVLVFDEPGTTRDSIEIPFERDGRRYTLIDTAGIRRRGKTRGVVEKFSVVKSLQAIEKAHVVVFLADAREGVVEQDLHLLGYVVETGRALVDRVQQVGRHESRKQAMAEKGDRAPPRFRGLRSRAFHFRLAWHRRRRPVRFHPCRPGIFRQDGFNEYAYAHAGADRQRESAAIGPGPQNPAALCPPGRPQSAADRDPRQATG